MPDLTCIIQRVKAVIVKALDLQVEPDEINERETIFGGGIGADSMASLQIIVGIEGEFGIEVEDEDLRVELFDSVLAMAEFVKQKLMSTPKCSGETLRKATLG